MLKLDIRVHPIAAQVIILLQLELWVHIRTLQYENVNHLCHILRRPFYHGCLHCRAIELLKIEFPQLILWPLFYFFLIVFLSYVGRCFENDI